MTIDRYVISWKSKVNGRIGTGSKLFTREEAGQLAEELNREYPEIEHDVRESSPEEVAARKLKSEVTSADTPSTDQPKEKIISTTE